jgi:hypothetical protein
MLTFASANCEITIGSQADPAQRVGDRPYEVVDIQAS